QAEDGIRDFHVTGVQTCALPISTLDLVIDYLTYVFIPAIFLYRFIPLPEYTALFAVGLILVSSLFCFCNLNMKSKDNYFVGFPRSEERRVGKGWRFWRFAYD